MARAWLTGDTITATSFICRRVRIPNDLDLIMAVSGALLELTKAHNWEQFGAATPDETAALMSDLFDDYVASNACMIGQIVPGVYADDAIPDGYLLCDGTVYDAADYPALFAVLDPALKSGSQFTVPDLRNRTIIGSSVTHPQNSTGGAETHALTTAELPAHTHTLPMQLAPIPTGFGVAVGVVIPGAGQVSGSAGSGSAHPNMQPFMALRFYLVAK